MTIKRKTLNLTQDEFVKKYGELEGAITGLSEGAQKVLSYLAFKSDKTDITIDQSIVDELAESIGVTVGRVRAIMTELSKNKILSRVKNYRSLYRLNPDYCFGKKSNRAYKFVLTLICEIS